MAHEDVTQDILKTVAYFDVFEYPLTALEVQRYCANHLLSIGDTMRYLDALVQGGALATRHGLYFFPGRQEIVGTRLIRYQQAWNKFAIARRAVELLRYVVGVRFIGVCNNTAYQNASLKSDIDVFIIVQQGRLWTARLLITLLMSVLRLRRHGRTIANRICLSFYVTDEHLDFSDIALTPEDPYLVYWIATLYPVYDDGVYKEFLAKNTWWQTLLPGAQSIQPTIHRRVMSSAWTNRFMTWGRYFLGGRAEHWAKLIQYGKIQRNTHSALHQHTTSVIVNDSMLKFHETDRRAHYATLWRERCAQLHL